jgi:hypothetical protein
LLGHAKFFRFQVCQPRLGRVRVFCVLVRLASCYTQFAAGNQGGGFGDKKNRAKIILTVFKARLPKNYYPHKHRRQPNIWR